MFLTDQTAINALCHNNIQIIPYKYATFAFNSFQDFINLNNGQNPKYRFNESELYQAYHEPTFLHFLGNKKPWYYYYRNNFYKAYWWYYAKKSGFYNEILNYYSNNINYVENLLKSIPNDEGLTKNNYKKLE